MNTSDKILRAQEAVFDALHEAIVHDRTDCAVCLVGTAIELDFTTAIQLCCLSAYRGAFAVVAAFADAKLEVATSPQRASGKCALEFARSAGHNAIADMISEQVQRANASSGAGMMVVECGNCLTGVAEPNNTVEERSEPEVPVGTPESLANTVLMSYSAPASGVADASSTVHTSLHAGRSQETVPSTQTTQQFVMSGAACEAHLRTFTGGSEATVSDGAEVTVADSHARSARELFDLGEDVVFSHILPCGPAGSGAFGTVKRGLYKGRDIAYKLERRSGNGTTIMDVARMQAFAAEARVLRVLQQPTHSCCLGFVGVAVDPSVGVAIVTEFIGGGNLRDRLSREQSGLRLSPAQRLAVCAGLASGLAYIHETGIVHGDIKPSNIMLQDVSANTGAVASRTDTSAVACNTDTRAVTSSGRPGGIQLSALRFIPKIIDFGGAYSYWRGKTAHTERYAAPELYSGFQVTVAQSDVYSLGSVMYELLTSEKIVAKETDLLTEPPIALGAIREGIESAVENELPSALKGCGIGAVIKDCWQSNAQQRLRSVEVYEALHRILSELDDGHALADDIAAIHSSAPRPGNSPLMAAIQYGETEVVETLITSGCDVNAANKWGHTPLHVAAAVGNDQVLKMLLGCAPHHVADSFGVTPRQLQRELKGRFGVVEPAMETLAQYVAATGANAPQEAEATLLPLHRAATQYDAGRAVVVANEGLDPLETDGEGNTAIDAAVDVGATAVVQALLSSMQTDARMTEAQWTALLSRAYALRWRRVAAVVLEALCRVNRNPEFVERCLAQCLEDCCRDGEAAWVELFIAHMPESTLGGSNHTRSSSDLRESHDSYASSDVGGGVHVYDAPLAAACAAGQVDVVELLLGAGADVGASKGRRLVEAAMAAHKYPVALSLVRRREWVCELVEMVGPTTPRACGFLLLLSRWWGALQVVLVVAAIVVAAVGGYARLSGLGGLLVVAGRTDASLSLAGLSLRCYLYAACGFYLAGSPLLLADLLSLAGFLGTVAVESAGIADCLLVIAGSYVAGYPPSSLGSVWGLFSGGVAVGVVVGRSVFGVYSCLRAAQLYPRARRGFESFGGCLGGCLGGLGEHGECSLGGCCRGILRQLGLGSVEGVKRE